MTLRDLTLRRCYDSDSDDILNDFYIPVLSNSIKYSRLTGFFSSTSLAIAARGIAEFILNGGHMQLVCGAKLSRLDIEAIKEALDNPNSIIEKILIKDIDNLENEFIRDHVKALAWMLANDRLEIKIAIVIGENDIPLVDVDVEKSGIFHPKIGILEDTNGNDITFSGSNNESASAWKENIENFKVFRGWIESEKSYFNSDVEKFLKFWSNLTKRTKVIDIPSAVKDNLLKLAPNDIEELNLKKWMSNNHIMKKEILLWDHQNRAILNWLNNNKKGIFEMATGTGKTLAALGCFKKLNDEEKKLVTVIACPYNHLIRQWIDDICEFGISCNNIIADSSNPNWKDKLANHLLDLKNGIIDKLIILTTHTSLPSDDFVDIIKISDGKMLLIVDEVHGIGTEKRRVGLINNYEYRLGLSATPKRWFDFEGTEALFDYFGNTVFEFSLEDAINTINSSTGKTYLVPYEYKPLFVELTKDELNKYERETKKISKYYHKSKDDEEKQKWFKLLCIKRQEIIKEATNKYKAFNDILDDLGKDRIRNCLVYCSPEQIDTTQDILNDRNIIQHKFTLNEGVVPKEEFGGISEREFLLKKFAEGIYQVLVAMKCLDEGVDVPPASIAIFLSSTGNPKEWIQRRGRILRHFPGKEKATIYDIIVLPSLFASLDDDFLDMERKILKKEFGRYREFASIAINNLECLNKIHSIEEEFEI